MDNLIAQEMQRIIKENSGKGFILDADILSWLQEDRELFTHQVDCE